MICGGVTPSATKLDHLFDARPEKLGRFRVQGKTAVVQKPRIWSWKISSGTGSRRNLWDQREGQVPQKNELE